MTGAKISSRNSEIVSSILGLEEWQILLYLKSTPDFELKLTITFRVNIRFSRNFMQNVCMKFPEENEYALKN